MTKTKLRREFLAKRRALAPGEVNDRSQLIAHHLFAYLEKVGLTRRSGIIHCFLPIQRHKEVDTWPIITGIQSNFSHIGLSVPVMNTANHHMTHYNLFPDTPLVENSLGIPEPLPGSRHETDLNDVLAVLVPLLAFDQQGYRVGYGGGYYDRFLAQKVPHSLKVGLSFFDPVLKIDPVDSTDVRLDACITPAGVCSFV